MVWFTDCRVVLVDGALTYWVVMGEAACDGLVIVWPSVLLCTRIRV